MPPIKISNLNHSYWDGSHDYWPHTIRERHACYTYTLMHAYLLNIQISDSKETIMVWYKNRNVQLPGLKNDSPQTSYILVTKSHYITYGQSFKLPQHLEWRRPWRLGRPNLIFFFHLKSELNEFYFFTFRFHSQS